MYVYRHHTLVVGYRFVYKWVVDGCIYEGQSEFSISCC